MYIIVLSFLNIFISLGGEAVQAEVDLVESVVLVIVEAEESAVAEVVQQSEEEDPQALDRQNGHVLISLHNRPTDTLLNLGKF